MSYRGYDLEEKKLLVGWQITTTKNGAFVRNSQVASQLSTVLQDAHAYVDNLIKAAETEILPP